MRLQRREIAVPKSVTLGWLVTILAPITIFMLSPRDVIGRDAVCFLAIVSAGVSLWGFGLVEEFIPGLLMLSAILAIGLVPPAVALSGFSSDGFFMTLGILALGGTISSSGLSYRLLLWMLIKLPFGQLWQNLGILAVGIVLTPLIPSTNGRVAMATPFAMDMIEAAKMNPSGRSSARLLTTAFIGVTALNSVFMTGKPMNLVVHSLLPAESRELFQWTGWLAAAAASGAFMIILNGLVVWAMLPGTETVHYSREMIREQIRVLGAPQPREWAAAAGIIIFALGILTSGLHKIQPAWLALAVPCGLLMLGLMHKREFRSNIDWLAGRANPAIVFAGISGDINRYDFRGQPNVTGVVSSRPYSAMRDLLLAANTFRVNHPITRIFHLSADYEDYEYPDPQITQFDWTPLMLEGSIRVATLEDWQKAVAQAAKTSDVLIVSIDEGMRRSAKDPSIASVREIIRWTEANSAIPVLGLTVSNVEDGCMAAVGVSPYEQGLIAGKMAIHLAERRVSAASIKMTEATQFVVALRESAMRRRGFQLPAIYHAFASATDQDIN